MFPLLAHERTYYTTTTNRLTHRKFPPQPLDAPFVYYEQDPVISNHQCFTNLYTDAPPDIRLDQFHRVAVTSIRMKEPYSQLKGRIPELNKCLHKRYFENAPDDLTVVSDIITNKANRTEYLEKYCRPGEKIYSAGVLRRAILSGKDRIQIPNRTWTVPDNSTQRGSYRNPQEILTVKCLGPNINYGPSGPQEWPTVAQGVREKLHLKETVYQKDLCDTVPMIDFKNDESASRPIDRHTKPGRMI